MAAPYDNVSSVINAAQMRLNDAFDTLSPVGGQILDNTSAFSQQSVNNAWRRLQELLVSLGFVRLQSETIISGLPALALTADPAVQIYLSWTEFFDGTSHFSSPVLPQDLIEPLDVLERPTGVKAVFTDMDLIVGPMPAIPKLPWNGMWQWRADALYMSGALTSTDVRITYAAYLADFVDSPTGSVRWFDQPVPILRALDPFASLICAEYAKALKNQAAATAYSLDAENSAQQMLALDYMRSKTVPKTSERAKMRDRYTPVGATQ
jgi:hypothetical protein